MIETLEGRTDKVLTRIRADLVNDPDNPILLSTLVHLLLERGELDVARTTALALKENHPNNPWSWASLGRVEAKQGRLTEVCKYLEHALVLDPLDRGTMVSLAGYYHELGEQERLKELVSRIQAVGGSL
jgi:predicted Zn-dependent protease